MSPYSSIPEPAFSPTGLVLPQPADVLSGVEAEWNAAFGGILNLDPTTPQGQLIASLAAIVADKNEQFLAMVNRINPDTADGVYQDAIGRIYFLDRKAATPTAVQCLCTGLEGTLIPTGALAQSTAGDLFQCVSGALIPAAGHVTLPFECTATGPVLALAGTVTKIYQALPGWDTITNAADGTVGQNVESRAEFEIRRQASVALNATGSVAAIYSNLFDVADVLDVVVRENITSSNATFANNVTLWPHSIYCCVEGGADADIAQSIFSRKSAGCDTCGSNSSIITGAYGQTYNLRFQRPAALAFKFDVQLADTATTPANIVDLVKAAIVSAFNGGDGGERARIGSTVYASRFYSPVAAIGGINIVSIQLAAPLGGTLGNSVSVGINQVPTLDPANITVTVS